MPQGRNPQSSFGRRGSATATAPRQARTPQRPPSAAPLLAGDRPGGNALPAASVVETAGAAPRESALFSYFNACVAALATAILLSGFIMDSNAPGAFTSRIFANLASGIVMMTLAPMMLIPTRILSDVMRLVRIPRGASDVLIGGLCGSLMMLPDLMDGKMPRPLSIAFVAGGLFGGFVFWRARGYPGLDRRHHGKAEFFNTALGKARREF